MPLLTSSSFLNALHKKNDSSPPVWLMRQAGRYLPDYQRLKEKYSLWELFHQPELMVETTLLPFKTLNLDAAILFSDIMTVVEGLGLKWKVLEQGGPIMESPFREFRGFARIPFEKAFKHVQEAIQTLKTTLTVPLIGFAGGPLTIASYLIEGKTDHHCYKTKQWMYTQPQSFHHLLEELTQATIDYLTFQHQAGADVLQLFESNAFCLNTEDFSTFCLPYLKKIVEAMRTQRIPFILFAKGTSLYGKDLTELQPTALSLDWQTDLPAFRQNYPDLVLQGNFDPAVLLGTKEQIKLKADVLLNAMKNDPGYIFNLGHGVLPQTPFENVQFLVDYVHNHS